MYAAELLWNQWMNMTAPAFVAVLCGLLSGEKEGRNFFARLRLEGCIKSPLGGLETHPENTSSVLHLRQIAIHCSDRVVPRTV
jgi:hypothetical protein